MSDMLYLDGRLLVTHVRECESLAEWPNGASRIIWEVTVIHEHQIESVTVRVVEDDDKFGTITRDTLERAIKQAEPLLNMITTTNRESGQLKRRDPHPLAHEG